MKTLLDDRRVLLPVLLTAVVIAVGSVLIVFLSDDAAGGSSSSAASAGSAPAAGGATAGSAVKVDIAGFKFGPQNLKVTAGTTVTWTNADSAPHTATVVGGFDTGTLNKGQSKAITLSKAGTYSYVCQFHPFMTGKVIVK